MDGRTINETSFISVFFLMELVLNKKKIIFTEIDFGSVISKTGLNLFYIVTSLFYGLVLNKKKKIQIYRDRFWFGYLKNWLTFVLYRNIMVLWSCKPETNFLGYFHSKHCPVSLRLP